MLLAFLTLTAAALAAPEGPAVPPPHRLAGWNAPLRAEAAGTRVAMIVEATDTDAVAVELSAGGAWLRANERWRDGRVTIFTLDLEAPTDRLWFRSPDAGRIALVDWDLLTPTAGEPRVAGGAPPPAPGVLPAELKAIGVTSRADWGADPTTCTSTEDDWYRMAIHHTAGSQTYGGTVEGAVRALQAYAFSTGEYCDIPYQFLVGYDGSLWEGRPYDYYSGATGGGNNDGNAAVCFLGCYHPSGCATSHAVTDAMMEKGQLLVQTVATLNSIPSDEDSIRGHRDWPDNATACPGDWLYDRLDELREPLTPNYAGSPQSLSCAPGEGAALALTTGEVGTCTLQVLNTGRATWAPGLTNLAPIPRDVASPLAAPGWLSGARVVSVSASTGPGSAGSFVFEVLGPVAGQHTLPLGLVHEGVTWFADDGGPADGAMAVTVTVADPVPGADTGNDTGDGSGNGKGERSVLPGEPVALVDAAGCGCASHPGLARASLAGPAALVALLRRRRRADFVPG
jgi:hypothetical protein